MQTEILELCGNNPRSGDAQLEQLFCLGAKMQHQAIARRAHQSFVGRGSAHGFDLQDWLEAEREILGSR